MQRLRTLALAAITMTATVVACGDESGTGPDAVPVARVTLTPDTATIIAGQTLRLGAILESAAGDTLGPRTLEWSSSDTLIATVDATGLVNAIGRGRIDVIARVDGATDSADIRVNEGPDPSLTRIEPAEGTVGTEVKVTGAHLRTGAEVRFAGLSSDSVDIVDDTLIFAIAPPGLVAGQLYDVTVLNRDSTVAGLVGAFEAVVPQLDFVNGASKPSGKIGSTVVIDGDAFADLQGVGQVLFSDGAGGTIPATIASEDDWTNSFILTTVPSGVATGDLVIVSATGTSNALTFTVTSEATFSPSAVDWIQTTDLPLSLGGHAAVFVPIDDVAGSTFRHVHVTGGASDDSVPRTDVNFAVIQATGELSAWASATPLPEARAFHASVVATPFNSRVQGDGWLYVLGGVSTNGGEPVTAILQASLNNDGTLGSWSAAATPLPEPLHSLEAVVFRSTLYIVGGATTGHVPVATVYRAPIDTLGQIGAWEQLPSLPSVRSHHEATILGNCLHVFGGDSSVVTPAEATITSTRYKSIVRARIDLRSGGLTAAGWSLDDSELVKSRNKHTALIAGGGVLLSAGLYDGIGTLGSSENMFAQIAADCDVDSFGGANNNRSIAQKGGGNLFNHAAISYVDANGVAHVMILGGDDVDNPGVKRRAVWFF